TSTRGTATSWSAARAASCACASAVPPTWWARWSTGSTTPSSCAGTSAGSTPTPSSASPSTPTATSAKPAWNPSPTSPTSASTSRTSASPRNPTTPRTEATLQPQIPQIKKDQHGQWRKWLRRCRSAAGTWRLRNHYRLISVDPFPSVKSVAKECRWSGEEGGAGGVGGGPGPLEVVAAEPAGDVDDFADEVQAGHVPGLHRRRRQAVGIHAAEGDFRGAVALGAAGD